ncbi:MAG TPA: hypothetical protein VMV53_07200 [Acidimicrobiales bacterium]|nr:hypothetical protein [Acidimicrobiales bacterium]
MALFSYLAALVPLNNYGHYLHWHFIYLSVANLIVILLMVATFVAALLLPFPGRNRRKESQ